MASATKRESVSFQRPLRSVTDAVSTRVTLVDAQPDVTTSAARNRLPSSARSFRIATILFLLQAVEGSFGVLSDKVASGLVEVFHLAHVAATLGDPLGRPGTGRQNQRQR